MKIFKNSLTMEHGTSEDFSDGERTWKDFEMKNLGDYHNLYVQGNKFLPADVFMIFCVTKYMNLTQFVFCCTRICI